MQESGDAGALGCRSPGTWGHRDARIPGMQGQWDAGVWGCGGTSMQGQQMQLLSERPYKAAGQSPGVCRVWAMHSAQEPGRGVQGRRLRDGTKRTPQQCPDFPLVPKTSGFLCWTCTFPDLDTAHWDEPAVPEPPRLGLCWAAADRPTDTRGRPKQPPRGPEAPVAARVGPGNESVPVTSRSRQQRGSVPVTGRSR